MKQGFEFPNEDTVAVFDRNVESMNEMLQMFKHLKQSQLKYVFQKKLENIMKIYDHIINNFQKEDLIKDYKEMVNKLISDDNIDAALEYLNKIKKINQMDFVAQRYIDSISVKTKE